MTTPQPGICQARGSDLRVRCGCLCRVLSENRRAALETAPCVHICLFGKGVKRTVGEKLDAILNEHPDNDNYGVKRMVTALAQKEALRYEQNRKPSQIRRLSESGQRKARKSIKSHLSERRQSMCSRSSKGSSGTEKRDTEDCGSRPPN